MARAINADTEARLLAQAERDVETGCLRWTGNHNAQRYGRISIGGRGGSTVLVHRAAYETWVGPIPDGLTIDHVHERGCRYRDCIEPTHLEPVPQGENARRQHVSTTGCRKGHPWSLGRYRVEISKGRPSRRCLICVNERQRTYYRTKKEIT